MPAGTAAPVVWSRRSSGNGEDDAARALEADTGVSSVKPRRSIAGGWRCAAPRLARRGAVVHSVAAPVEELAPEASAWEAEALEAAVGRAEAPSCWG